MVNLTWSSLRPGRSCQAGAEDEDDPVILQKMNTIGNGNGEAICRVCPWPHRRRAQSESEAGAFASPLVVAKWIAANLT